LEQNTAVRQLASRTRWFNAYSIWQWD